MLAWIALKTNPYHPRFARWCRRRLATLEREAARPRFVRARKGVVLASGGFIYNRELVERYAPKYRPGMPLGAPGCCGDGILLGMSAGGAVERMDRVSAWRFINPPEAFVKGVFVDRQGQRYANERPYGAQLGRRMVEEHRGEGTLIIDQSLFDEARAQMKRSSGAHWFQRAPALLNLYLNRHVGESVESVAGLARIDAAGLRATVDRYNAAARGEQVDAFSKAPEFLHALERGPFYAIDCGLASRRFPCPTLTLGGLSVDEQTGAVIDAARSPIRGLFAAGRCAVGVCSMGYVSGLSLADCVFSGRRAGRATASSEE